MFSREGGEQVEAGDAERVDHAVGAAGEHDVGFAAADDLGRLADGLAAGGAGGEAVEVRAFGAEMRGHVGGRHVRFLLELELRVEPLEAFLDERGQVELAVLEGGDHHVAEVVEVLLAFAGAEVDAEAIGVDGAERRRSRPRPGLAAPMANFVWRPRFSHTAASSPTSASDQLRTSAEMRVGKLLASKSVVKSTPDLPSLRLAHSCGTVVPRGVTQPMPVTTTRRLMVITFVKHGDAETQETGSNSVSCSCVSSVRCVVNDLRSLKCG